MPCNGRYFTRRSATGSALPSSRLETLMSAPMRLRISITAWRVGLIPTPSMTRSDPGTMLPAARKNAAEEISPGMRSLPARKLLPCIVIRMPDRVTGQPKWASIRSV